MSSMGWSSIPRACELTVTMGTGDDWRLGGAGNASLLLPALGTGDDEGEAVDSFMSSTGWSSTPRACDLTVTMGTGDD